MLAHLQPLLGRHLQSHRFARSRHRLCLRSRIEGGAATRVGSRSDPLQISPRDAAAMNTALSRLNAVFAFSLSVLATLTFLCFLSTAFLDKNSHPSLAALPDVTLYVYVHLTLHTTTWFVNRVRVSTCLTSLQEECSGLRDGREGSGHSKVRSDSQYPAYVCVLTVSASTRACYQSRIANSP